MVTIVLKKKSRFKFTGCQNVEAACPDLNLRTHQSDYTVPCPEDYNFES